jgi:hypothetical protein|tara:strand:+ start:745 stop:945 length:201 start_codon:yes stop_codon:yes gene_type:complete
MERKRLIENIEREDVWDKYKYVYADRLLKEYDSESVRKYLRNKSKTTGDYYYCSILKETNNGEEYS